MCQAWENLANNMSKYKVLKTLICVIKIEQKYKTRIIYNAGWNYLLTWVFKDQALFRLRANRIRLVFFKDAWLCFHCGS